MTNKNIFYNIIFVEKFGKNVIDDTGKKMLAERIKELMKEQNLSLQQLIDLSGVNPETVRNIYYGKVNDPKISTALAISKVLKCSINHLAGADLYTPDEIALVKNYRKCGKHGKGLIAFISRYEANTAMKERESRKKRKIPCLVPLGKVQDGFTYTCCEVVEIETTELEAYTAVEVTSNFYAPVFCKGDKILLTDRFPDNGEIGVFVKDGKGFIREFEEYEGKVRVKRINGHVPDFDIVRADQIECVGTYIGVVRA